MKVLILAYTSKEYKSEPLYTGTPGVYSDRADLTRKLYCMDTWVGRIENLGHEVIFFDGGNETISYDNKNKILHLTSSDSYDYHYLEKENKPSFMLIKLQEAIRWSLENKEFDYILRVDDGTYVNSFIFNEFIKDIKNKDIIWSGYGGGGGIFFSRKACIELIKYKNEKYHLEDIAIFNSPLMNGELKIFTSKNMCPSYVLGEGLVTIHYATGKRMYYCDFVISSYYNNQSLDRKVVLNYPLNSRLPLKTNTIDCSDGNTPLWYGLDRDKYNWEYYGAYTRSSYQMMYNDSYCILPFKKNSISKLFIYDFNHNVNDIGNVISSYLYCIKEKGSLFILLNNENKEIILNNLKSFNYTIIKNEDNYFYDFEYITNLNNDEILKIRK